MKRGPALADVAAGDRDSRLLRLVDRALTDLRRGGVVLLEEAGQHFVAEAAEGISEEGLGRMRGYGRAGLSLALTRRRAAALGLIDPPSEPGGTILLPVPEASAASLLRNLADPAAAPAQLGLVAARRGTAMSDAAVDLAKLAGLLPAVVVAPVAARTAAGLIRHEDLLLLRPADIFAYRSAAALSLRAVAEAQVPLVLAEDTRVVAFRPADGGVEHIAIVIGAPDPKTPVLTRLHSECFTGDVLGSLRCDCGDQLRGAIGEIARAGGGVLLYLAQEGRGIGLVNKLRAYQLQDAGHDTVDANEQLGFDPDERIYLPAAEMLRRLGFDRVRLLTNNPEKVAALTRCGIAVVERVPHVFPANGHNERYLRTKAERSGHFL
jgi:GTP cyclohydrolase II